jgi:hypothetical protein
MALNLVSLLFFKWSLLVKIWLTHGSSNWGIYLAGYAGQGVLNMHPTVLLNGARPPLISFIGPGLA